MLVLICGEVGLVNYRYGKWWKKKVKKEIRTINSLLTRYGISSPLLVCN